MQLFFKVQKPLDFVFNYLTDMQLFASVHPVITRIDHEGNNYYKVFETIQLGPIPVSFTYKAILEFDHSQNKVTIIATVMRFTKIEMYFHLSEQYGCCTINESIQFRSVLPIKGIMKNIFKSQHTKLFGNINNLQIPILPL
jgi:carbon monoxide dehydrogenase subunit G